MAGIDYTIPGQFKGVQLESPMNAMAQAMQLRALYDASQMNALKFEEAQRDAQERNALAKLDPSSPEYLTQLKRVNPKLALDYQKSGLEADSARITKQKNEADLFQAELKKSRYFLEGIDPDSPTAEQDFKSWHESNHANPILNAELTKRGVTKDAAYARIDAAVKSGRIKDLILESKLGMEKFIELTPASKKAEKEEIDQEFSDYLNTPGNPVISRLEFVKLRESRRRGAPTPAPAPAPDAAAAAAPAPAPAPAVASAAVDLTGVPRADRSIMFNRLRGNQPAFDQLGGFQTNAAAVNNLGVTPAADRAAPATNTTQTANTKDIPLIHPDAQKLYNSTLPGDKAKADAIQRNYENLIKQTDNQRNFAAAKADGFKGTFPEYLDQQRESPDQMEYRRLVAKGEFKGTFLDYKKQLALAARNVTYNPAPITPVTIRDPNNPSQNIVINGRNGEVLGVSPKEGVGVDLTARERQAREAKYPQATASVKTFESKSEQLAKDLEKLANHPGLDGISGAVYGRLPSGTKNSMAAQELYNSIVARGGFKELADMRAASPTGGALGNVSNQEGQYLRDAFASIGRIQSKDDLAAALIDAAKRVRESKGRIREAYDMTYEYRDGGQETPAAPKSDIQNKADAVLRGAK